ncbi:hypothetical protein ATANTOWER_022810, partial [Ataeniobius toweri]|nr:hypothetical protein [Ataeniobius toweri]
MSIKVETMNHFASLRYFILFCHRKYCGPVRALKLYGPRIWAPVTIFSATETNNPCCVFILQEIKDTVDGQRILEKKGSSALKDLKRQLQLERKRADKLQERLQEILTNSKTRTGLEELVLSEINSPSRTQQTGDSSSISSFSYKDMMKEAQPANQNR